MNGQHAGDHPQGQQGAESQLSLLFGAAGGQNAALLGLPAGLAGAPGLRYGMPDASLEEQILQRASALRAEALMQQQQQHHQRQNHLNAALAAAAQQQHFSSLGLNPNLAALMEAHGAQEHEALLGRAAALRDLGIGGAGLTGGAAGIERLQQIDLGRLEELERRRQQLAALSNLSGGARPPDVTQSGSPDMVKEAEKEAPPPEKKIRRESTGNAAEKSREDLRKTPGTVIVPCRARGMPMDHNFKTAYFVISEDAKHGEDLVCSYFACRNGGVKFRYCAHCMAPVAKRNFCRRHDHGMSIKPGDGETQDDEDETSVDQSENSNIKEDADTSNASISKNMKTSLSEKQTEKKKSTLKAESRLPGSSLDVLSKAATSSFLVNPDANQNQNKKRKQPEGANIAGSKVMSEENDFHDGQSDQNVDGLDFANISSKRRRLWSALLVKRPRTKDPRHMTTWLEEVLTVSDLETNLDGPDLSSAVVSNNAPPETTSAGAQRHSSPRTDDDDDGDDPTKEIPKEKKSVDKKKKKKPETKPSEPVLGSANTLPVKFKKEDKPSKKHSEKKTSDHMDKKSKKTTAKEVSSPKKDPDDGFVGSFADWRDRKKEKALSKKGGGSLRK